MAYFNIVRAFPVVFLLALTNIPIKAETLYTRLACETVDGSAHIWIHSKAIAYDNGKPAIEITQTSDPQTLADQIWADMLKANDSDAVMAEHAEPFRKILLERYGLLCNGDVGVALLKKSLTELEQSSKLADGVWIKYRKQFDNVDLEIRVIAYPEE